MTPSHAVKAGVRYRYYISRASTRPEAGRDATIVRLPAPDVEEAVLKALADHTRASGASPAINATAAEPTTAEPAASVASGSTSLRNIVERINVRPGVIEVELADDATDARRAKTIVVPWSKLPTRVQRDVVAAPNGEREDPRAMSSDSRSRLLSAIAIPRRWMDELTAGKIESVAALAAREGRSARSVTMLLSLAFLAPDLVKAIVDNRMPRGIGLTSLTDLPLVSSGQRRALGLPA